MTRYEDYESLPYLVRRLEMRALVPNVMTDSSRPAGCRMEKGATGRGQGLRTVVQCGPSLYSTSVGNLSLRSLAQGGRRRGSGGGTTARRYCYLLLLERAKTRHGASPATGTQLTVG